MAQADGSIVVDTELQTEGFDKGSKDMQRAVNSLQSKVDGLAPTMKKAMRGSASALESFDTKVGPLQETIAALEDKMGQLGKMRIPTDDYSWLQTEIAKAEKELDKLLNKEAAYEDLDVSKSSQKWKTLQYSIEQTERKLEEYRAEAAQMEENGTSHTSGADSAEYDQLSTALDAVKEKLDGMVQKVERGTSAFAKFGSIIGKGVVGGLKGMVSMLGKGAAAMLKLSLRAKKTHSSFNNGIGTLLRYGLGVRSLFTLMSKLRSALVDGYKNLARYSSRTNAAISSLMSALTRLKNSFAAAFDPILRAAAPALVTLINLISNAVSKIGMLTAALTGAKTFTKATTIQEDYAKSLDKTSKSAKKAKAVLASFDELNILDDNSSDSTKDDGSVDPSKMFEQVPIDSAVLDFADKLKKAFEEADWKGLGTLLGDKINELVDSVDWSGWGTKIGKGMNAAIQTLYYTVDTVDWVNIGKHLAEAVNSIINEVDWDIFGRLLAKKFTVALDLAGGFLKELDWTAVLQAFTSGFSGFYDELQEWLESKDWYKIGEIITAKLSDALRNGNVEGAVKSFFDAFTEAINSLADLMDGIDFYQVAKDLVEMLIRAVSGVSWDELTEALGRLIGESVDAVIQILAGSLADVGNYFKEKTQEAGGDAVAGFFLGIKDAIFGVGAWIVDNIFKPFWNGICDAFEIHSPSKKMVEVGKFIMEGLKNGITGAISTVVNAVKELPGQIVAKLKATNWVQVGKDIIGAIYNGFVALQTKLPAAMQTIGAAIKKKLSDIDWLTAGKNVIGAIYNGFVALQTKLPTALKSIGDAAKKKLSSIDWVAAGKNVIGFIYNGFVALQTKLPLALKSIGDTAKKKFTDIDWLGVGKNVILGIYNGIKNTLKKLSEAAGKASNWLINAFKDALGIHSPSTEGAELGYWFDAGVAQGIVNNSGAAEDVAGDLGLAVYNGADDALDGKGELLGEGFVDETVDALTSNMNRISDALSSGKGISNIKGIVEAVKSGDWATVTKNVALGLFNSLDKNFRTNVTGFVADSLDALNAGYDEQGFLGMAKAAVNIVTGLKSNLSSASNTTILKNAGKGLAGSIKTGMEGGLPDLWTLVSSIPGKILELLSGGFGQLKQWGGQFIDWLTNLFKGGSGSIQTNTGNMLQNIGNTFKNFFNGTSQNGSSFIQNLGNVLKNGLGNIQNNSSGLLNGIKNLFSNGFNNIASNAGNLWNSVKGFFSNGLSGVASNAGSMLSNIGSVFSNGFSNIASGASGLFSKLGSLFSGGLSGIASTVGGGLSSIAGSVGSTIGGIASTVGGGLSGLVSSIGAGIGSIGATVSGGLGALASGAAGVAGTIGTTLSGAVATAGTALGGLGTTLAGLATAGGPVGIAIAGVGALGVGLVTAYNKCDWFRDGVNNAFNAIKNTVTNVCKGIGNVVSGIWDGAKNVVSGAINVGKNIVTGIGTGIKNVASGLWNGVKKVGSGIVNGFKSFFGIHSPSRLMADEIGAYLPAGIDEGMKGAMPALLSSAKDQMGDLVDTVKAGTAEADGTLADSDTPLLSEVSGKVDIVEGMDNVLTQFSDKVADSFTNLLDRLTEITQNAGFSIPALATGTVTPYSVEGGKNSSSGGVLEKIQASNDETTRTIVQAIGSATNSICAAVEQYSGAEVNVDADGLAQHTVDYINRKTRMFGTSPLLTPAEV